jgi:transcriptional regulator with XRE-family HTH domain
METKSPVASRVHLLRKTLKLTQSEFADKLKLKFGIISAVEVGRTPLTEQNLKMICSEFSVSEQWLRTGEGEMFTSEDPDTAEFLAIYRALSPPFRKMFLEYGRFLIEQQSLMP